MVEFSFLAPRSSTEISIEICSVDSNITRKSLDTWPKRVSIRLAHKPAAGGFSVQPSGGKTEGRASMSNNVLVDVVS